jgi:hypothetical protein
VWADPLMDIKKMGGFMSKSVDGLMEGKYVLMLA